jgi:hypothetical protein
MIPPHEAFAHGSAVRLLKRLVIAGKWVPACAGMTYLFTPFSRE